MAYHIGFLPRLLPKQLGLLQTLSTISLSLILISLLHLGGREEWDNLPVIVPVAIPVMGANVALGYTTVTGAPVENPRRVISI